MGAYYCPLRSEDIKHPHVHDVSLEPQLLTVFFPLMTKGGNNESIQYLKTNPNKCHKGDISTISEVFTSFLMV